MAALYSGMVWALRSRRLNPSDVAISAVLGLSNAGGNSFLLRALDHFTGVVTFPVTAAGGTLLAVLFAACWWKEMPSRVGMVGVALAVLAVVLVNL